MYIRIRDIAMLFSMVNTDTNPILFNSRFTGVKQRNCKRNLHGLVRKQKIMSNYTVRYRKIKNKHNKI